MKNVLCGFIALNLLNGCMPVGNAMYEYSKATAIKTPSAMKTSESKTSMPTDKKIKEAGECRVGLNKRLQSSTRFLSMPDTARV